MNDLKTSFDFIRVQSKLNKLVDDFMYETIRTAVRFRPSPQRDVVQLGRTLALGARGRWFKSSHLDKKKQKKAKKTLTHIVKKSYCIV